MFGNAINGSKSCADGAAADPVGRGIDQLFPEIDIAKGSAYFAALAATNGTGHAPARPDAAYGGGSRRTSCCFDATNRFARRAGVSAAAVDIPAPIDRCRPVDQLNNFGTTVNGAFTPSAAYAGYLFVDADMLSNLGIESTLIGGYRGNSTEGTLITATALNVEIATNSTHALTGPELLFSSLAPTAAMLLSRPRCDSGSVIEAEGTVAGNSTAALVIGVDPVLNAAGTSWTNGVSGDGALLRVSNGGLVDVIRHFVPGIYQVPSTTPAPAGPVSTMARGSLTIGAGAVLSGNTLTLDSSGTTIVPVSANLTAKNYDLSGAVINLGDGTGGLVISTDLIGKFAGADVVRLRSASVFYLSGNNTFGDPNDPIGTLIFDGAGLYSDGGKTSVAADNIVFVNTQQTASSAAINTSGSGGQLTIQAGDTFTFGGGARTLSGFAAITATGGSEVVFTGGGSLDAKGAAVSLTAPLFLVDAATSQSLTTTGALTLAQGAGSAPAIDSTTIGGILRSDRRLGRCQRHARCPGRLPDAGGHDGSAQPVRQRAGFSRGHAHHDRRSHSGYAGRQHPPDLRRWQCDLGLGQHGRCLRRRFRVCRVAGDPCRRHRADGRHAQGRCCVQ